jgi:hypothetical protein
MTWRLLGLALVAWSAQADESALRAQFEKSIKDKDPAKRQEAVKTLRGCSEEATIRVLISALADPQKEVRRAVAEAVEGSQDGAGLAIKSLASHLVDKSEDPDVRLACARALRAARYKEHAIEAMLETIAGITNQDRTLFKFGAEVTDLLNALIGEAFPKGKQTVDLVTEWWKENKARIQKEDRAAREEYSKSQQRKGK